MSPRVALVDHGMGNLRSVSKALEAAGADTVLVEEPSAADGCDGLCVPGQGIFGRCVTNMTAAGFDDLVRSWIGDERPYLGICLGLQILFDASEEPGSDRGLGIIEGGVRRLRGDVRIPHIGWNTVGDSYYYFDHSYFVSPTDENVVSGWCEHGLRFAASVDKGSILGVQFHPEKSSSAGIRLLKDWVNAL